MRGKKERTEGDDRRHQSEPDHVEQVVACVFRGGARVEDPVLGGEAARPPAADDRARAPYAGTTSAASPSTISIASAICGPGAADRQRSVERPEAAPT